MDVLMPQLGETVAEGKIVKWFKAAGDMVQPGDNLFEIETDKTSMEVPATFGGKLAAINFGVGETAKVGAVVAEILGEGEAPSAPKPAVPAAEAPAPQAPEPAKPAPVAAAPTAAAPAPAARPAPRPAPAPRAPAAATRDFSYPHMTMWQEVRTPTANYGPAKLATGTYVTPLARRLASERGIDLNRVSGSGPHGRIVAQDIEKAVPSSGGGVAQFYLAADVEIGRLLSMRDEAQAAGAEFSIGDFAVKAWAAALARLMPEASAEVALVQNADGGRVTKVIRHATDKALTAVAREAREQAPEAANAASAVYVQASPGIREFTAVVTPPLTSVLAVGAPRRVPVEAPDGGIKFVGVVTVTLSCDHRAVDEALGAELLAAFKGFVEAPVTALL